MCKGKNRRERRSVTWPSHACLCNDDECTGNTSDRRQDQSSPRRHRCSTADGSRTLTRLFSSSSGSAGSAKRVGASGSHGSRNLCRSRALDGRSVRRGNVGRGRGGIECSRERGLDRILQRGVGGVGRSALSNLGKTNMYEHDREKGSGMSA